MSDDNPTADDRKTFSQEDVDRIVADRLKRENVRQLKADSDELKALRASQQTEADKVAERLAKLEAENVTAKAEALRLRIAAQHGVSADDAELFLTGTDEQTLTRQAQRLAERVAEQKRTGNVVPTEGKRITPPGADPIREFTRGLFQQSQE